MIENLYIIYLLIGVATLRVYMDLEENFKLQWFTIVRICCWPYFFPVFLNKIYGKKSKI